MDKYTNYNELKQHERQGEDYVILLREGNSRIALIAPHGGGIEPGTIDIADAVAGSEHTFYAFKGIKKKGNAALHITSDRFDEPKGVKVAENADIVVSIHGCHGKNREVFIGGKNQKLRERISDILNKAGFNAGIRTKSGQSGQHPENICNRGRTGEGVQLEITQGLREKMFDNLHRRSWRKKNALFYAFINSLKESLR